MSRDEPVVFGDEPIDIDVHEFAVRAPVTTAPERRAVPACTVAAMSVRYLRAGRLILDAVDVHAGPGESVAVVGPSGSGKSTLLALLAGLEAPDSGAVQRGCDDGSARVGLILQGYGLVSVLTAAENVEIALQAGVLGRLSPSEIRARSSAALEAVGLSAVADHLIEELSGGQQQRVAVARAIVIDPAIVIADEITAELDHDAKEHIVALVLDVARRGGVVVLATHDPDIARRCSRSIRLVDGRVAP